jgi:hypothetical protein
LTDAGLSLTGVFLHRLLRGSVSAGVFLTIFSDMAILCTAIFPVKSNLPNF